MNVTRSGASLGFDCDVKLTYDQAKSLFAVGFQSVTRYVPLPGNGGVGDIDADEVAGILQGGLALRLIQHVRLPGWAPTVTMAQADGLAAVTRARAAGYLPGCHLWMDLEGVASMVGPVAVIQYVEAWASVVLAAGFRAGLYYGVQAVLSGAQLYGIRGVDQYMRGANISLNVANRGCSVIQMWPPVTISGVNLDVDVTIPDNDGDTPYELTNWTA